MLGARGTGTLLAQLPKKVQRALYVKTKCVTKLSASLTSNTNFVELKQEAEKGNWDFVAKEGVCVVSKLRAN